MDYRGLTFSDRNLAFTGAPSDAKSKNHRADENQDLFHDDATRVYPLKILTCTVHPRPQLVRKSHTPHFCAELDGANSTVYQAFSGPGARSGPRNKQGTYLVVESAKAAAAAKMSALRKM
jgi:hypothetical protein